MRSSPTSPTLSILASSIALMFAHGAALATELPANVQAAAQQAGITLQSDGGFTFGGTQYVPLLPPGYTPSNQPSGNPQFPSDGSIVWGNLQFAPLVSTPGELTHLPDNLQLLIGNTHAPDFQPPAGFVPSEILPLPSGVLVPPLSNAQMVQQMVDAGALPPGLVQFNTDGTVAVSGGSSYLPFLPPESQRGLASDPSNRSIHTGADGTVTFPDGSTYGPLVPGSIAGGTTLVQGFQPPSGTFLSAEVSLPLQFEVPLTMQIPAGMILPAGVFFPENYSLSLLEGTQLPPGANVPAGVTVHSSVTVPPGFILPAGTTFSSTDLPLGTTILPNGSVVFPGFQISSGVIPGPTWIPPQGTVQGTGGTFTLPTPPTRGFAPPIMATRINSDGSVVMPADSTCSSSGFAACSLPPGATLNSDGTMTIPPPAFVGSVGTGGAVQGSFGFTPPPNFIPVVTEGSVLQGAGTPAAGVTWQPPTTTVGAPTTTYTAPTTTYTAPTTTYTAPTTTYTAPTTTYTDPTYTPPTDTYTPPPTDGGGGGGYYY